MFRPTGVFDDLMCPDARCTRPNCLFWHNPEPVSAAASSSSYSVAAPPSPQYDPSYYPASYSAQPVVAGPSGSTFSGYTGYVEGGPTTSSTIAMYAPEEPTVGGGYRGYVAEASTPVAPVPSYIPSPITQEAPPAQNLEPFSFSNAPSSSVPPAPDSMVKQEVEEEDEIVIIKEKKAKKNSVQQSTTADKIKKLPLPKLPSKSVKPAKQDTLLEAATDVAKIDAEIERLMQLRKKVKKSTSPPTSGVLPEYVPEEPVPEPSTAVHAPAPVTVIGYTPTPLAALKKKKEEEQKQREKERKEKEKKRRIWEEDRAKRKKTTDPVDALFDNDSDDDFIPTVPKKAKVEVRRNSSDASDSGKLVKKITPPSTSKSSSDVAVDSKKKSISVSSSSKASSSKEPEKVERGKGLTAEQIVAAKQRLARPAAGSVVRPLQTTRRLPNAAEQLQARMQAIAKEKEAAAAKAKLDTAKKSKALITEEKFYGGRRAGTAGTVAKGEARSSRLAQASSSAGKPQLREPTNPKVAMAVRLPYLNRIFTQLMDFLPRNEAIQQAEEEEKAVLDRISHKQGYMVGVVNTIKRIRDAAAGKQKNNATSKVSHGKVLAGKGHNQITIGANGPKRSVPITEGRLYEALVAGYLLTEEQMARNSYPRYVSDNRVYIEPSPYDKKKNRKTFVPDYALDRICSRCSKEFSLCPKGTVRQDTCIYHLKGKGRKPGKPRNNESIHPCCGADGSVAGCQVASCHVTDTLRNSDLCRFVSAPPSRGEDDHRNGKVFAMDCEMVYTVWGPALARVTVVDINEHVVLDEIVKPDHTVTDYNTNFSGITSNELETATCTLTEAQERLFELINSESILIGHSLESDLKAMRLVHDKIVDTAVLFPHRTDNDKKRGLKELAMDKLQMSIQDDIGGHDSKEDSVAALRLVLFKVKFDGKL